MRAGVWADMAVWALLPEDFAGYGGAIFGKLQRVGRWSSRGPELGREARALIEVFSTAASRRLVGRRLSLELPRVAEAWRSTDGARIEAVHMPRAVRRPRVTVCLSTQVGCAMGCGFCATARLPRDGSSLARPRRAGGVRRARDDRSSWF